ncbi:UNVERIFIED_CONTAM: hypothetical protein GTU68_009566, partial [Idotea baltica]|nr:hypothetical protein [Idotea baltica]
VPHGLVPVNDSSADSNSGSDTNSAQPNLQQYSLAVSANGVSHAYNRRTQARNIITDLNLSIKKGETMAVVGRSGSGKSTLLNILGGLEPLQQGELQVLGQNLNGLTDGQRTALRRDHVGFIYQAFNLIPTLSVADNITLPLALKGVKTSARQTILDPLIESIGLSGRGNDYPDVLSGGEQQRVAIARALIHKPALVLADEPTGNLDAQSGRQILALLQGLVNDNQSSLVLVTHSLEVAGISDSTMIMTNGTLEPAQASHMNGTLAW